MTALLAVGLIGFFADPLHLPSGVLGVLDQRASVISMFVGAVGEPLTGHAFPVCAVAFHPDGDLLAAVAHHTIRLYSPAPSHD
ncbi:WD40 repeat domain-containing protein [Nonomuraea sp. NPDC049486]|uniref:WD40 repeat domain-containing protein n=1 Tax=Nonomuraea sp. NPDC049486 TaxID=3155773 RepID=UPI00341B2669